MNILVSAGRFSVGIASILVVIVGAGMGSSLGVEHYGIGTAFGGVLGALVGLLIAGSVFGALAALFEIATASQTILCLLEQRQHSPD